ncbi:unnamed protein product [Clavelina lepadiformis]|uniref:Phosphodiesterase n=1 Tax=Clavelina lepadiformis TaxID=159417 RepID=A0ABP0G440_CLALP
MGNSCVSCETCSKNRLDNTKTLKNQSLGIEVIENDALQLQEDKDCETEFEKNNYNLNQRDRYFCCRASSTPDFDFLWCNKMEIDATCQDSISYDKMVSSNDLHIGSLRISKPQFKALLIFPRNDEQSQSWRTALTNAGFHHDSELTTQHALDSFHRNQHHLVIIDNRQYEALDVEFLCRALKKSYIGSFTTIVAIMRKRNQVDELTSTRELLNMGFDRLFHETTKLEEIEDEVMQLEAGPLVHQLKFRSCQAVFTALERSRDSILITDEHHQIQYVNKMYEQLTGFSAKQVMGSNLSHYIENEKNEEDTWDRIRQEIQSGKEWDGILYVKRKSGEDMQIHVLVLPLSGQDECIQQYVVVSRPTSNNSAISDLSQFFGMRRKNSYEQHRKPSGNAEQLQIRRSSATSLIEGDAHRRANSLAKIHSMAIEAPITQIINLISMVKDSSQPAINEVLDQILDILRNSELYSPADLPSRSRDPMLSDFVEGLVTGTGFSHRRSSGGDNLLGKNILVPGASSKPSIPSVDPDIAVCLENLDSWDYDVLALERVTSRKPLVHLGMQMLDQFNVCEVLGCSQTTLHSWLVAIESNYHSSNPYHNSTHAADVLQATAYFLKKERLKAWMEPLDEVSALLAAIIHDVDHPGRTNAFLVNSNNPLALLYNDTAVLESHHAAFAFKFTVNNDKCNIFKNLSKDNFMNARQSIIDMVLATELSKHFEHVNKFISIVTKNNNSTSPFEQEGVNSVNSRASGTQNPVVTYELKTLIKRVMIKVADVINPARKTPLCVEWARRISEEYFSQTDEEKQLGLPVVMPHFDRNSCSMPKSQMTFIDYFLTDMFEAWHEFCGMEDVMNNLNDNYNYWKKLQDRGIMRLAELEDESFSDEDLTPDGIYEARQKSRANESQTPAENNSGDSQLTCSIENHL